jgi:hypothetical protein
LSRGARQGSRRISESRGQESNRGAAAHLIRERKKYSAVEEDDCPKQASIKVVVDCKKEPLMPAFDEVEEKFNSDLTP